MGTELDALRDELASARSEIADLRAEVATLRAGQQQYWCAPHPWMPTACAGAAGVPQMLYFNTDAAPPIDMTFGATYGAAGCAPMAPVITWNVPV